MTRKPVAFKIDSSADEKPSRNSRPAKTRTSRKPKSLPVTEVTFEPENFDEAVKPNPPPVVREPENVTKAIRWGAVFMTAFIGLLTMWASVAFIELIESLFARSKLLGWIGTGFLGLAVFAALAVLLREIIGVFSLRKISRIREDAETALNSNDQKVARKVIKNLQSIYANRADVKWGLAQLKDHENDIIDGADRITIAERDLLGPLDQQAGQIIASASRRVTLLTAVTPAAVLDILFVAAQNMKMLRQLASLYGGRPGTFGTVKLAGMVVSHLAVTGGLALTDNLVQQFIGKGLLSRLSARLGEGAVNGILTTRIGLAALDMTRPIPFSEKMRPDLVGFLKNIISFQTSTDEDVKPD